MRDPSFAAFLQHYRHVYVCGLRLNCQTFYNDNQKQNEGFYSRKFMDLLFCVSMFMGLWIYCDHNQLPRIGKFQIPPYLYS